MHDRRRGSAPSGAASRPHRPEPGLQSPVVCLDRVVRVLLDSVEGRGNQFVEYRRGEAVGDGVDVGPGQRVYSSLWPVGGGFAELAVASVDPLAPMPDRVSFQEAAGLVIGGCRRTGPVGYWCVGERQNPFCSVGGAGDTCAAGHHRVPREPFVRPPGRATAG
jgi:hypothetical protein